MAASQDAAMIRSLVARRSYAYVEIGDAAAHGCACDEVVTRQQQLGHEIGVVSIALDEPEPGVIVVGVGNPSVLGEVVDADDLVAASKQLLHHVAANETG